MAQNKLIFAILFLILIFAQEIQCIEGRRLLVGKNNEFQTLQTQNKIYEKETFKHSGKLHGDDSENEAITKESPPTPLAIGVSQPPPPTSHDINQTQGFRRHRVYVPPSSPNACTYVPGNDQGGNCPGVGNAIEN